VAKSVIFLRLLSDKRILKLKIVVINAVFEYFLWTNYIETLALSLDTFCKGFVCFTSLALFVSGKFALAIC